MLNQKFQNIDSSLNETIELNSQQDTEINITNHLIACVNQLYRDQNIKNYDLLKNLDPDFKQSMDNLNKFMSKIFVISKQKILN